MKTETFPIFYKTKYYVKAKNSGLVNVWNLKVNVRTVM